MLTDADVAEVSSLLAHERRGRADELRAIGAGARLELLPAAAEAVRAVQIAVGVDRHLVDLPERTREGSVRAPGVQELSVQVVLENLRVRAVRDPHVLIG